ncbi:hypothetical protein B0H13DRAFT_1910008 [Mycena leptocephala]|nr:hypothetical protein B0H13DRAFT_1910008 [Mycena leptocephala]
MFFRRWRFWMLLCLGLLSTVNIRKMLAGGQLPAVLKQVLENPRILKVGCSAISDLKYLQEALRTPVQFSDGRDLAKLATEGLGIPSAQIGLGDLCGKFRQIQYAALDVYAGLAIYEKDQDQNSGSAARSGLHRILPPGTFSRCCVVRHVESQGAKIGSNPAVYGTSHRYSGWSSLKLDYARDPITGDW